MDTSSGPRTRPASHTGNHVPSPAILLTAVPFPCACLCASMDLVDRGPERSRGDAVRRGTVPADVQVQLQVSVRVAGRLLHRSQHPHPPAHLLQRSVPNHKSFVFWWMSERERERPGCGCGARRRRRSSCLLHISSQLMTSSFIITTFLTKKNDSPLLQQGTSACPS